VPPLAEMPRGRGDRALACDGVGVTSPQERNVERIPLRCRQRSENAGFDAVKQI